MATITRGTHDQLVEKIQGVLDEYEREHPGSVATLYRHNSAAIRIRIVDDRFKGKSKPDRHDQVWDFLESRLDDDDLQEISILLPLTNKETKTEFMNTEFDDPIPCNF